MSSVHNSLGAWSQRGPMEDSVGPHAPRKRRRKIDKNHDAFEEEKTVEAPKKSTNSTNAKKRLLRPDSTPRPRMSGGRGPKQDLGLGSENPRKKQRHDWPYSNLEAAKKQQRKQVVTLKMLLEFPEIGREILAFLSVEDGAVALHSLGVSGDEGWSLLLKRKVQRSSVTEESRKLLELPAKEAFDRRHNEELFVTKKSNWLERHRTLRKSFFPILCNWLVELHFELFGDHSRTLMCRSPLNPIHLAMKYLFRFLDIGPIITSNRLQLVGVACYQIAVDYALGENETKKLGLDSKRYAYYTDNAYKEQDVTEMTAKIKKTMKENRRYTPKDELTVETPPKRLNELMRKINLESYKLPVLFGNYLVDLSMHDTYFSEITPSEIAAAAVLLACEKAEFKISSAQRKIVYASCYTGKSSTKLTKVRKAMNGLYEGACKQETGMAIFNNQMLPKYSMVIKHYSTKFMEWVQGKLSPKYRVYLFKNKPLAEQPAVQSLGTDFDFRALSSKTQRRNESKEQ
mmetsp:Transcript_12261/g.30185  ORF Transcript_12261/g.30185 Transcript_12261/m.30185 type:complete len:514 (-) Transcript_12261:268-1809(-)